MNIDYDLTVLTKYLIAWSFLEHLMLIFRFESLPNVFGFIT